MSHKHIKVKNNCSKPTKAEPVSNEILLKAE